MGSVSRGIVQDLAIGARWFAKSPGAALTATLMIGLSIGISTAVFSVVKTALIDELPVRDPGRLFSFQNHNVRRDFNSGSVPLATVTEWRREMRSVESIEVCRQTTGVLTGEEEPFRANISRVSWGFFQMLGVAPAKGRGFRPEDGQAGSPEVALVSHALCARWLGGLWSPGATIRIDGRPFTVIGVLPERFRFVGVPADIYVPLAQPVSGERIAVGAYARLRPGVTRDQLRAELDRMTEANIAKDPRYRGWVLRAGELEDWVPPDVRTSLWVLLGAVGLVLLISCANVAGLLMSRAVARRKEVAIRAALGATRTRLVLQLLTECLPLAAAGGGLGVLLANWGVKILPQIDVSRIPRVTEVRIEGSLLALAGGLTLLTCLLSGLLPALTLSRADLREAMTDGGWGASSGRGHSRARSVLVVAEVGLAMVLTVGAVMLTRSFLNLSSVRPGFDPENLLAASMELPRGKFTSREQVVNFAERLMERVRSLPGVSSACLTNSLPLGGEYLRGGFIVEGQAPGLEAEAPVVDHRTVDWSYLQTMRIRMVRGRGFEPQDRAGTQPVVVLSESTARKFFPGQDPIGRKAGYPEHMMTVIGIAADVRHTDVSEVPETEVLLPFAQLPVLKLTVVVRVDPRIHPDPMKAAGPLRRVIAEADPALPVHKIGDVESILSERLGPRRLNMALTGVFATLALLLAALGIYGVLAHLVSARSREIGVRMALGARADKVVWMVVRQAMTLVLGGLAAGVVAALGLAGFLRSLLYGVSELDPVAFGAAAITLVAAAAAASWVPARRAARVDPVTALRWE